ncbi:outer membrane protein assembly factor BamE [Siccirubricoccus sp. KC 17139]|uniref:Outer membrane protein assembly factor BamE n=1 Tax=Siccirubricoccus soli TaxID=2899147 RepID=A0ABT1D6Z7_9PROT|nr:outer membrane protein assembly factor BamE [Siccirubricoccus soli]MCO6417696.1 outer membrane protein assembly factor BamE [Siccirubricoccus soli]MCP2683831.1 outer membrane protein assembly factor BamE [Siccirubricoccus soli]
MDRPTRTVNAACVPAGARAGAPGGRPRGLSARLLARPLAAATLLLLASCSIFDSPTIMRGNRVSDEQIAQITPGVATRQDVQALLGSPTQSSTFGDGAWYYISSNTRVRPGRELAVTDQRTVAVLFDNRGVVQEVKVLGAEDGKNVTMVARETPTPGTERTLMQALFGNVGRFGMMGQQQPAPGQQ